MFLLMSSLQAITAIKPYFECKGLSITIQPLVAQNAHGSGVCFHIPPPCRTATARAAPDDMAPIMAPVMIDMIMPQLQLKHAITRAPNTASARNFSVVAEDRAASSSDWMIRIPATGRYRITGHVYGQPVTGWSQGVCRE